MKVTNFPNQLPIKKTTLVMGAFESFHHGHEMLTNHAKTFKRPITLMILEKSYKNQEQYATLEVRLQQLANFGIDQVLVIDLDKVRDISGQDFFESLKQSIDFEQIVIGKDFAMGKNRDVDAQQLKMLFPNTHIVDFVKFNDKKISTSVLKELVELGQMDVIKKLSTFSYTIDTEIQDDSSFAITTIKPHTGVYAAWVIINEIKYWSVVKIGIKNNTIMIPDLIAQNQIHRAWIEMRKLVRSIISDTQDKLEEKDIQAAGEYLQSKRK